jgi:hypothetical protein
MEGSNKPLRFTETDIPMPPFLRYGSKMDQLITDWNDSSHIHINDVPIPLRYWSQVYRWNRPDAWKVLKNEWHNWRVLPFSHSFGAPVKWRCPHHLMMFHFIMLHTIFVQTWPSRLENSKLGSARSFLSESSRAVCQLGSARFENSLLARITPRVGHSSGVLCVIPPCDVYLT